MRIDDNFLPPSKYWKEPKCRSFLYPNPSPLLPTYSVTRVLDKALLLQLSASRRSWVCHDGRFLFCEGAEVGRAVGIEPSHSSQETCRKPSCSDTHAAWHAIPEAGPYASYLFFCSKKSKVLTVLDGCLSWWSRNNYITVTVLYSPHTSPTFNLPYITQ